MGKKKIEKIEFRYYEMPQNEPVLALLGDRWVRKYGWDIDYLHFHNLLEIGYCHYGNGILKLEEEEYRYNTGMVTVIPKNLPHTTTSDEHDISYWEYLFIDIEQTISQLYKEDPIFGHELIQRINERGMVIHGTNNKKIVTFIKEIIDEMGNKRKFYKDSVRALTIPLLLEVARINQDESALEKTIAAGKMLIEKALEYTNMNYSNSIKVEEMADVCHMSETNFRRRFEESMNMTPVEYINLVRIQKACELMIKSNDSMTTVAAKVGFLTPSTFNRNFKKLVGISPYQWKNNPDNYEGKLLNYKISARKGW